MEYILTKDNFDEIALGSTEPILVDFWASWCGPCMMLSPIVEELSKTHKVGKVNVDEEMALAQRCGITSLPPLLSYSRAPLYTAVEQALASLSSGTIQPDYRC